MPSLGDRAFQTWVEGISAEKRYELGLALVFSPMAVFIDQGLETCDTSNRLSRPRPIKMLDAVKMDGENSLDMVDVIVVHEAQVWWIMAETFAYDRL